ncbi:kinase-like domain-containing protein [Mycena galericulata]|nr:kinase-like domain-containing protein [Mycena galericulata]
MYTGLGERCDACGSTTALPQTVPRIEIESLDMIPFSDSFSGLFRDSNDRDGESDDERVDYNDERQTNMIDMSYNVEQFSDVRDLDPEWDDEDVAEVMVLSPKQRYSTLPTISEENDAFSLESNEAHCSQTSPPADSSVTLADFDIIPTSGYPMLCRKRSTEKVYIIKALELCEEQTVMACIRTLHAPFLERVHWSFPGVAQGEEGRTYLVSESHSGNLMSLMKSGRIAAADALFYICEIVDGISSLHAANIIHRDLTPANIFIDHTGHIALSNFCNAAVLTANKQRSMPPSAAIEYQAPEILLGWAHDFAVDCWSLGVLLHFLLTGINLAVADDTDAAGVRSQILAGDMALNDMLPPEAKDLIGKCLERNPVLRLSIESVKKHDYFANVLSYHLDISLDLPFTLHTASKAVRSQLRLERVHGGCETENDIIRRPYRSSSMDDLRSRSRLRRLSLNIPMGAPLLRGRRSIQDADPSPPPRPAFPRPLSLQVQSPDILPKIFKPTVLDDRLVEEEESSHPSPVISSPTVCEVSPRERMAQFWERLDAEDQESASSVPSLELRDALKLALPCPRLPVHRSRSAKKRASSQAQAEQRLSILSTTTTNKLRKLRRPLSTPLLSKRSEPILNLPSGVEQIGKGIGFTYKMPVASHSKASICTTAAPSAASKFLRGGLGLGRVLRKAKSQPKFSSAGGPDRRRTRGPPEQIQTSLGFVNIAPPLDSPASDGPLTPDSITFPPLPDIVTDPFAKDGVGEEPRIGCPDATLRLVSVSPPNTGYLPHSR